jgi:hypothetical protein
MKATVQRRLTLLVGLLLLSLLVFAIGAQVAQASLVSGNGGGGSASVTTPAAGTEVGRGGVGLEPASGSLVSTSTAGTEVGRGGFGLAQASGAQTATSGTSSTTYWLIGSAVAVLIAGIGAWALLRRRRQPAESASADYCARHPGDSLCGAV